MEGLTSLCLPGDTDNMANCNGHDLPLLVTGATRAGQGPLLCGSGIRAVGQGHALRLCSQPSFHLCLGLSLPGRHYSTRKPTRIRSSSLPLDSGTCDYLLSSKGR